MTVGAALGSTQQITTFEEGRLTMTESAVRQRFASAPRARITIEAGTHSPWVYALLTEFGHEVLVANPRKLRLTFSWKAIQAAFPSPGSASRRSPQTLVIGTPTMVIVN